MREYHHGRIAKERDLNETAQGDGCRIDRALVDLDAVYDGIFVIEQEEIDDLHVDTKIFIHEIASDLVYIR